MDEGLVPETPDPASDYRPDSVTHSLTFCETAEESNAVAQFMERRPETSVASQRVMSHARPALLGSLADRQFRNDEFAQAKATGSLFYMKKCSALNVTPSSRFLAALESDRMNLNHYGLGQKGAIAMADALRVNRSITALELVDNGIMPQGCVSLAEALSANDAVALLDLSSNAISQKGGLALMMCLRNDNHTLVQVHLAQNKLNDRVALAVADVLAHNRHLRVLDLAENQIGEKGALALAKALEDNSSLESLNLAWNQIRGAGAQLAKAVADNTGLVTLNLSWNGMNDACGVAWGATMADNDVLEWLDLGFNRFGAHTAEALVQGIQDNSGTLATLSLSGNPLGPVGAVQVHEALTASASLKTIGFEGMDQFFAEAQRIAQEQIESRREQELEEQRQQQRAEETVVAPAAS